MVLPAILSSRVSILRTTKALYLCIFLYLVPKLSLLKLQPQVHNNFLVENICYNIEASTCSQDKCMRIEHKTLKNFSTHCLIGLEISSELSSEPVNTLSRPNKRHKLIEPRLNDPSLTGQHFTRGEKPV